MSKITFRADDELIKELESFDASKSEVMRQALREYLDSYAQTGVNAAETADSNVETGEGSIDELVTERVDALIENRLGAAFGPPQPRHLPQDLNVNITLDGDSVASVDDADTGRKTDSGDASDTGESGRVTCGQCGENVASDHVYCPNCGEKVTRRIFCDCGDEIRSDWAFCPSCGRRTPAADVLDST
jgi:Arc/MetJ-type ribon-helix-helix transcriptional regulator